MVPDNMFNTSASTTTSPLFPNTTVADLGISSGLSGVDGLLSKSIGSPSSLNSERTASQTINFQNNDSLITGDGSGTLFAGTGKDIIDVTAASMIFASGGGFTAAINDLGAIAGTSDEIAGRATDRGLLWQKKDGADYTLDITDLGGVESYFFDINKSHLWWLECDID